MTRMIVGFDPSKAQSALAELRSELAPGVEWRVLNLDQNPNGVEPLRTPIDEEHPGMVAKVFHRLAVWLGRTNGHEQIAAGGQLPENNSLELSEAELDYLRHAPARSGTVILVTAPDLHAAEVRMWSLRHGGFDLAPATAGSLQP
jgi:hypothetical protein